MNNYFDRGWFRDTIYTTDNVKSLIELIKELNSRMKNLNNDSNFKVLSDPNKTKIYDQYKTAMNVTWDKIKNLISQKYLYVTDEEKQLYKLSEEEREILNKEKKEIVDSLFDKDHFQDSINEVTFHDAYLEIMYIQFTLMRYTLVSDCYMKLHPYNKRKQKDLYFSSINECWKLFSEGLQKEFPLLSESKRSEEKRNHIKNRRKRHEQRGLRKKAWKQEKAEKVLEMMNLSDEEFNRVQAELEAEYRRTRNLPEVPEV